MYQLSPQTTPSSSSQADSSTSHFKSVIALLTTQNNLLTTQNNLLTVQNNTLHAQIYELQQRINELEAIVYPIARQYRAPDPVNTVYSPIVKLSFKAMKLLFLFLAGFAIAYVLAGSLGATQVIDVLQILMSAWLAPLAGLTFCTIAVAAIVESLK